MGDSIGVGVALFICAVVDDGGVPAESEEQGFCVDGGAAGRHGPQFDRDAEQSSAAGEHSVDAAQAGRRSVYVLKFSNLILLFSGAQQLFLLQLVRYETRALLKHCRQFLLRVQDRFQLL